MEEKESLTVEYLISINSKNIFNTCSTIEAFNNLLCSNSKIKLGENKLIYSDLEIDYMVQLTGDDKIKFYHMIFKCNQINKLKLYEEFLRGIKCLLNKVADNGVIVLWDDISAYYCTKSYPIINSIENTMRKLLTKFMMINIGEDWDNTVISDEIKKNIAKNNNTSNRYDYLYKTDFIALSDFLFKEYPNKTYENFNKEIKKMENIEDFDINDIIKRSNWDRYFKDKVGCAGEFLKKRWEKLYDLRCKVAHNNTLERNEYNEIEKLVSEIKPFLESVLDKLDEINIEKSSKSTIVENIIENIHPESSLFLEEFRNLVKLMSKFAKYLRVDKPTFVNTMKYLYEINKIDEDLYKDLVFVNKFRNKLLHFTNERYSESEMAKALLTLVSSFNSLQEVYSAMISQES